MDFSSANNALWNIVIQFGLIAAILMFSHFLRRKVAFIGKSLMPTAVLAGFILLIIRNTGLISIDVTLLEMITYHGIAIGFIAMTLQVAKKGNTNNGDSLVGAKSGALIVSTYLVQGIMGLGVSLFLLYTVMPQIFAASGILLPMGFGQGPGQANNVGSTYEALGFVGGRSFGLSIAAAGYLSACVVGIIYINFLVRKKGLYAKKDTLNMDSGSVTVDTLADEDEMPASESMDRLSVQVALVLITYLLTYLVTKGITAALAAVSPGLANTVSSILWGFNFIVGSLLAMGVKCLLKNLRQMKVMTRQYQNNYLLSRISGLSFDLMIVAGIASINIENLSGLWLPFIIMVIFGSVGTLLYLKFICKRLYKGYEYEALLSMYGMLTGTISSGVLLLREVDPDFVTPAANNLIYGSSFAIAFGAPMLLLISIAPKSIALTWAVLGLLAIYMVLLLLFMLKVKTKKKAPSSKKAD